MTNAKLDKTNIALSGFGAAAADVNLGANKLTDVADPTLAQDAATKAYVDTANNTNANLTGMVTSVGNVTTVVTNANLTGDISSTGNATTIGADKVVSSMIVDATIVVGDLADDAVETIKIKDLNVTNAKLDKTNIALSGFGVAIDTLKLGGKRITGVENPTYNQDAATKAYVDTEIAAGTSASVSTINENIQSSSNDSDAATGGVEYSATANIASGSRIFNSANNTNTFNAGIDLGTNSIVTITLTSPAINDSGPTDYDIQPVVSVINTTDNTFTIKTYVFGSIFSPSTDFTFYFMAIK